MVTYEFTKLSGERFIYFFDINTRLWTVTEIDSKGGLLNKESDYYHNRTQMVEHTGFNFKTVYVEQNKFV